MSVRHSRLLILGSGPAGYSAAVYAARANRKPLLITGLEQGGQLMTTTDVDNWPGDVEHLQGPQLMERMRRHAERFNTEIVFDHINRVELRQPAVSPARRQRRVHLRCAHHRDRRLGEVSGPAVRGSLSRQRRLGVRHLRRVLLSRQGGAVVGGGNTAVEEALYLSNIASHVTLVHRRDKLRAEKILQDRLFALETAGKVAIVWNHTIDEILGDEAGVTGARLQVAARRRAALGRMSTACSSRSAINRIRSSSSISSRCAAATSWSRAAATAMRPPPASPGVFAAGDVADHVYRQAVTSAGTGCMAALDADKYLERLDAEQHLKPRAAHA